MVVRGRGKDSVVVLIDNDVDLEEAAVMWLNGVYIVFRYSLRMQCVMRQIDRNR